MLPPELDSPRGRARLLATTATLVAAGPISLDLYLPAFPSMAESLGVQVGDVQLTMSAYLLGLALGQLVYGPLSDRFGRKPPLIAGLILYTVASLLCVLAPSLPMLVALRVLQALGGCAPIVISRAVVRDCFEGPGLARAFSVNTSVSMAAPVLAPTIGALILRTGSWHGTFLAGAAYGAVCLVLAAFLPETHPAHHRTDHGVATAAREYVQLARQRQFAVPALIAAFTSATLFAYISSSSSVFMGVFHVSAGGFGLIFGLGAVVFVSGSLLNMRLVRRHAVHRLLRTYLVVQALGMLVVLAAAVAEVSLLMLLVPLLATKVSLGGTLPNASAETVAPFPRRAGSAAALMGTSQMAFGAIVTSLLAWSAVNPTVEMAASMTVTTFAALALALLPAREQPQPDPIDVLENSNETV